MAFLKNIATTFTDAELVQQYKQTGSLQVLGELYQRYMDLVYGVCLKYTKDPEDARDCVLTIFEELVSKLQKHPVEQFKSWLYRVAQNHCLMRLRSQKGKLPLKMDMGVMQSDELLHLENAKEREMHFKAMEYCMGQLVNEQRQAIELFYLQGKCYQEIAGLTQLEWNQVRSYIQNGRRNLKICMDKQVQKSIV